LNIDLSEMILTDVLACNRINVSSGTVVKRENRPQYAIAVKTSGKTIYYSNGKEYLSDSNHICLLPKGATYSFNCIESGECLMLEFMCRLNAFEPCSIETNRTEEIIRCFRLSESSAASKKEGWKLQVFASLYSIF